MSQEYYGNVPLGFHLREPSKLDPQIELWEGGKGVAGTTTTHPAAAAHHISPAAATNPP
jgi:hypothetical protein